MNRNIGVVFTPVSGPERQNTRVFGNVQQTCFFQVNQLVAGKHKPKACLFWIRQIDRTRLRVREAHGGLDQYFQKMI